jgi:hypothetical protein
MGDELRFAPYQEIEVSRLSDGEPYQAHLLTRVGDSLLIDRPRRLSRDGEWRYLEPVQVNDLLRLGYEHDGVFWKLKAPVTKVSCVPFFHLCLKLEPGAVGRTEIRSAPRYRGLVPVVLSARRKDGREVLLSRRSYMVDIGRTGIGVISESKIPRRFLLALEVAADCRLLCKCRVRNVKEQPVRGFFYYGCEIEEVSQPDRFAEYLEFLAAAADLFAAAAVPVAEGDYSFFRFA